METSILQLAQSQTGNSEIREIPCSMVLRCLETSGCLPSLPEDGCWDSEIREITAVRPYVACVMCIC